MESTKLDIFENCTVLLLDDNDDDLFLTEDIIQDIETSINVVATNEPNQALIYMTELNIDICIVDYHMGSLNGLEFIRRVVALGLDIPIILLTNHSDYSIDVEAMNAGAEDFLNKAELSLRSLEKSMRYALRRNKDTKALKESEERLHKAAFYDNLTGLPNRALFLDRLGQAFHHWHRSAKPLALLFIDLDGFKPINDSFGHEVGDRTLKTIGERLAQTCRATDTVARLGGDEFTILINDFDSEQQVMQFAHRMTAEITKPISFNMCSEVVMGASIGVAFSTPDVISADELLRAADIAMYNAKRQNDKKIVTYKPSMFNELNQQTRLEQDLRQAINAEEFELLYQPIVCLNQGSIYGFEALLRWQKKGVLLTPDQFLDTAENSGEIVRISEWVMLKACSWAATINKEAQTNITVNISQKQFEDPKFVESVKLALLKSGLHANHLHLEMSEQLIMKDIDAVRKIITELKAIGVNIYLDDFGTGYSSLQHILQLPIDAIKIDRSFIKSLPNPKSEAILSALLSMSRKLNIEVIAEGIEEIAQLEHLKESNCQFGQGFLFAKPLNAAQCESIFSNPELFNRSRGSISEKDFSLAQIQSPTQA